MKRTILSIEDDSTFAEILLKSIDSAGYQTLRCANGEDGLKRANQDKPDAILLDIGLPRKDGFEVLESLKSDTATSAIPVFMLSRLSSREDIERCFALGCEDYLIKSQHHPDDIVRRLHRYFGVQEGFARWEVLVALGVLLIAASLLWYQLGHPKQPETPPTKGIELQST